MYRLFKRDVRVRLNLPGLAASVVALAALWACPASAACSNTLGADVSTWVGGSGNWNENGGWTPGEPNSQTQSACIVSAGSAVSDNVNARINDLQLGSTDTLIIDSSNRLSVFGTEILNAGSMQLSANGSNAVLDLSNNLLLSGGGNIELESTGAGIARIQSLTAGNFTLTNADNTIAGAGVLGGNGLSFVNESAGTLNANVSGKTLTVSTASATNSGVFEATNGGTLKITNAFTNAGTMTTSSGGAIVVEGGLTNKGQVIVDQGTTISASNTYLNEAGTTVDGTLQSGVVTNSAGALLEGTGTVRDGQNLINDGILKPGDGLAAGTLTVLGNYTQDSTGTLQIDIGGTGAGQYSQLDISGVTNVAGTLALDLTNGFTLVDGDVFTIMKVASLPVAPNSDFVCEHNCTGNFTSLTLDGLACSEFGTGQDFAKWSCPDGVGTIELEESLAEQSYLDVIAMSAPEPSSVALLGSGLLMVLALIGRRRRRIT